MSESHRRPNNVLIRVDHESDTDSTSSFSKGSSRGTASTSRDTPTDGPRGHYRGITFEEILPPQFISNAPPPTVEPKHGSTRHTKSSDVDGLPVTSESPVKRSYPSAKPSDSKPSGGNSRIRNTARALARGLSIMKKRDSQGYEAVR